MNASDLDTPDFYDVLGLDLEGGFTDAELRAAYRRASRAAHPDLGGDEQRACTALGS